jgi:hypothetical protein
MLTRPVEGVRPQIKTVITPHAVRQSAVQETIEEHA